MYAHIYGNQRIRIKRIKLNAFYLIPSDREIYSSWRDKIELLLNSISDFHNREFQTLSEVSFELYPEPVRGNYTTAEYRDLLPNEYFHKMLHQVMKLKPRINKPDFYSYLVFADWGLIDNPDGNGGDTYIGNRKNKDIDVSDIKHIHGCLGCYYGDNSGSGLITEEAWKHPEIEGTDIVVYHEGLGHPLNMPHTGSETGVMGYGQYAHITLQESSVDLEIFRKMIHFSRKERLTVEKLFPGIES